MANRNRVELSIELFSKLISAVDSIDLGGTGNRWIERESAQDADLLATGDTRPLRLGRRLGALLITHNGDNFLALTGVPNMSSLALDGLTHRPPSPALFQLAVSQLDLRPSASSSLIRDALEGRSDRVAGYNGHQLREIEPLFDPISFWEIGANFIYAKDIRRILGSAICRSGFELPLAITDDLRRKFDNLFTSGDDHLPFALLLQALLAAFWQTQFVEIYRCVEQLFPAELLLSLKKQFRMRRSLRDINERINRSLNWRPREDTAIRTLFEYVSRNTAEEFRVAFNLPAGQQDLRSAISTETYKLRNSVVHYRSTSNTVILSDNNWNNINFAMLNLSDELYARYAADFFGK